MRKVERYVAWIVLFACCTGCGNQSQQLFRRGEAIAPMQLVVVLPFENLTADPHASEVMTELFAAQLFRSGSFKILDKGEWQRRLQESGLLLQQPIDRQRAMQVARLLAVDGVFYGSVIEYTYLREVRDGEVVGREPAVGLQARLIDAKSGQVVWAAAHSRSSYEMLVSNRESLTMVAEKAIAKMTATLRSE